MKYRKLLLVSLLIALVIGNQLAVPKMTMAQNPPNFHTVLTISDIIAGAAVPGSVFTTDVSLAVTNNAEPFVGIMGIDTLICYDSTVVAIDDADDNPSNGTQVTVRNEFFGSSRIVAANQVETIGGGKCVHLAISHTASPITNRSGQIATIRWAVLPRSDPIPEDGIPAGINIDQGPPMLADSDGNEIPINNVTIPNIIIGKAGAGIITGRVRRQGARKGNANTSIIAYSMNEQKVSSTLTDYEGEFKLEVPTGSSYLVRAAYPGYLNAQRNSVYVVGAEVDIGSVSLVGGDVNGDNNINILDIVKIVNDYGTTGHDPSVAVDINDDGIVNIYDLTIAAGNFNRAGPTNW